MAATNTGASEYAVMPLGYGPDGEGLLSIAAKLTEISLTAADFESLFECIAGVVRGVIGPVEVGIDLHMRDGDYLQLLPGSFGAPAQITWSSQVRVDDPLALSARVMRSGRGMSTEDAAALVPELADWWEALGVQQLLSVVLPGAQRRVGVLHVANPSMAFTSGDLALLEQISPFLAAAIEHAVRRIVMDRNERLNAALFHVASEVTAGRSLVELSPVELSEFCAASHIDVLAISFTGEARPRVVLRHGRRDGRRSPPGVSNAADCARARSRAVQRDRRDRRVQGTPSRDDRRRSPGEPFPATPTGIAVQRRRADGDRSPLRRGGPVVGNGVVPTRGRAQGACRRTSPNRERPARPCRADTLRRRTLPALDGRRAGFIGCRPRERAGRRHSGP